MRKNMLFVISYITYSMYHYIYFNTCISFSHVSLSVQPPQKSIWVKHYVSLHLNCYPHVLCMAIKLLLLLLLLLTSIRPLGTSFDEPLNQNATTSIQETYLKAIFCKAVATSSWPQFVNAWLTIYRRSYMPLHVYKAIYINMYISTYE